MEISLKIAFLNTFAKKTFIFLDTGIFIKVNCISTEFTPKKHGGEKGVPFRLQVETYDNDAMSRIHAAGCILQVFKLKGADRKHKQDRDKINKRPLAEQEKFSPSFDCTVLADLPLEHIYVPVNFSRPNSPVSNVAPASVTPTAATSASVVASIETAPLTASVETAAEEPPPENNHVEQSMLFLPHFLKK